MRLRTACIRLADLAGRLAEGTCLDCTAAAMQGGGAGASPVHAGGVLARRDDTCCVRTTTGFVTAQGIVAQKCNCHATNFQPPVYYQLALSASLRQPPGPLTTLTQPTNMVCAAKRGGAFSNQSKSAHPTRPWAAEGSGSRKGRVANWTRCVLHRAWPRHAHKTSTPAERCAARCSMDACQCPARGNQPVGALHAAWCSWPSPLQGKATAA